MRFQPSLLIETLSFGSRLLSLGGEIHSLGGEIHSLAGEILSFCSGLLSLGGEISLSAAECFLWEQKSSLSPVKTLQLGNGPHSEVFDLSFASC